MKKPVIGSIYSTKDRKREVYRLQWNENGKIKTKTFPKTSEGLKNAYDYAKQLKKQQYIKDALEATGQSQKALSEAIKDYIIRYKVHAVKNGEIKRSTLERLKQTALLIPDFLLVKKISEIKPDDIQDAYNTLSDMFSASQVIKVHDLLNAVYKNAEANREIYYNPMRFTKRPKNIYKEKEIYTKEEVLIIFNTIRKMKHNGKYHSMTHDYYLLFKILITTGLRIGEAIALRYDDFDLEKKIIHIRRTRNHFDTETGVGTPKTRSGKRDIPLLSKTLCKTIQKKKENQTNPYLFATKSGKLIFYSNFYKTWTAIGRETAAECPKCHTKRPAGWTCSNGHKINRNGIKCRTCGEKRPEEWICPNCGYKVKEIHKTPHTTRHTFCSYLMEKGINIQTIKYIAGHSQASTTLNIYGHITENMNDELYEKLNIK